MGFDLRDLLGADLVWLLKLTVGDQVFRLAREPESAPTGINGADEQYHNGLDFSEEVEIAINPFGDTPEAKSIDLTLHLQGLINVADLMERGYDWSAGRGTLMLWAKSRGNAGAVITIIDGVLRAVEYETDDDPITLTLEEIEDTDPGKFPPADARVSTATFPNAAEKAEAEYYPWVFGEPGRTNTYPVPVLMVDATPGSETLLAASHHVAATSIKIVNDDDESTDTLPIINTTDGVGRPVATVDLSASATLTIDSEAQYFATWSVAGGGFQKPDGTLLQGLGDVWEFMTRFSKRRIDQGRTAAAVPFLNGFILDFAIVSDPDDRFTPWDWIQTHLIPIVPVTVRSSPDGFYPQVTRLDADETLIRGRIDVPAAGEDNARAVRIGSVQFSGRDRVANEIILRYANDPRQDAYLSTIVLTGDRLRADADRDARLNIYCLVSADRYRDHRGQSEIIELEIQSDVVQRDGTAAAIAGHLARRYALQARLVGYTVDVEMVGHLEPGDIVGINDTDLRWTAKLALVEALTKSRDGFMDIDVRIIEDPARVLRI